MIVLPIEGAEVVLHRFFPEYKLVRWAEKMPELRHAHIPELRFDGDPKALQYELSRCVATVKFNWFDDLDGHECWAGQCLECKTIWFWGK